MVNVVVVDDEERIRQGLAKLITQAGDEFIVTGIFSSGQELLSNMDTISVDLVITDIKMPMMNGLQLIEKLQLRYPKLKLAIVSGFDDFSFARQALRFGVEEYLLKPVDRGELEQLLHKVRQKLDKEQRLRDITHDDQLKLILINDPEVLPEHLRLEACEELEHMPLFQEAYMVFVIRGEQQLTQDQIQGLVSGWLPNWLTVEWDDHIVLIVGISSSEHADRVREVGQTLMHRLPVNYKGRIGGSDVFRGTAWLREAYRQGILAMQYAWYDTGKSAFADYARIVRKAQTMTQLFLDLDREFQAELAVSDYKKAEEAILGWLDKCMKLKPNWTELREGCEKVWVLISRYRPGRAVADQAVANERIISSDPQKYGNKEMFITAFLAEVRKQLQQLQEIRQESRVIETVKQFIYQHYTEELELNRLAEEVFLTPSYLSKLFKTETGETITDFLISVRIDRAKELLREEFALKTYEVGERVGYADPAYFNKVFKKLVGSTPKEFRDRVR
jgi:two-component system response regulator YesN